MKIRLLNSRMIQKKVQQFSRIKMEINMMVSGRIIS